MAKVAAKVYGDALFELAVEENRCDQFLEEICAVENALDQNPQAETLLCHPGIGSEEKQDFIEKCFKGNVSDDMTGFLQILVKKGRFSERNAIFAYFTAKVKEYKKIGVALVTSPFELTAEQKTKIEKRLLDTTDYKKMEITYREDKTLIGGLVIRIGDRDGSFAGAQKLAALGINTIGIPGTIDLDIACTEYTIGFDTAVNTAMEAIDKVRDTSTSHERCSIIEVMGRGAGYIALYCGIANGAEDILLPEKYDYDEQKLINNIIENRKRGKKHHIIINAEGIGHSASMARRIEAATGMETRATILGHMQRGGSPTCTDRVYASMMGSYAVDLLAEGKTNRVVGYRNGEFTDFDIDEALAMQKSISEYMYDVSKALSI